MAKVIRMGVKFRKQSDHTWYTMSWEMDQNSIMHLWQLNVTWKWAKNMDDVFVHWIDFAGRTHTVGVYAEVKNKLDFRVGYNNGYPHLILTSGDADNYSLKSVIFEDIKTRLHYISDILPNDWEGPHGYVDVPWYNWFNDTGCICRPPMISVGNVGSDGIINPNTYLDISANNSNWLHSESFIYNDHMRDILKTIRDGNITSAGNNSVNINNTGSHMWNSSIQDSLSWAGDVTSSLVGTTKFHNVLSLRRVLSPYNFPYRNNQNNPPWGTGNRGNNSPGWWKPQRVPVAGDFNVNRFLDWWSAPYSPVISANGRKALCASLFIIDVVCPSNPSGRDYILFPIMGAIDDLYTVDVKKALDTVWNFDPPGFTLGIDNTIYTTLGGPDTVISGITYAGPNYYGQSRGSVGIRAVTYENNAPVPVTSNNYKQIIDTLLVPSLFSDWFALDIYGLRGDVDNDGSDFVWDADFNLCNAWDENNWSNLHQTMNLYSTVNFADSPVVDPYDWPWPSVIW